MALRSPFLSAVSALVILALAGCNPEDGPKGDDSAGDSGTTDTFAAVTDADGDGVTVGDGDCDDADPEAFPGRAEDCDGLDNNCNGIADEGLADADADGTADCADAESCDGLDNDGDGRIDEDFADADNDGVADCAGTERCDGLDNNADGRVDEGFDADGDGFTQCGTDLVVADCDDADAAINPDAVEAPTDQIDNNCDGLIDESGWRTGDLTVSEIMANPGAVSDPSGEYFEVYNASSRTLILNGLVLTDSGTDYHVVTSEQLLTVEPGEFFVFALNDDGTTNGDVVVDYVYTDLVLSNEDDDLRLYAGDTMLDEIVWDDGRTMPDPEGASFGMDLDNYDADLNDDPTAWCAATEGWTNNPTGDFGSPGDDNEYCSTFDHDGDGLNRDEGDCDDGDATTYPGAFEGSDPADNDCDGVPETAPVASATSSSSGYSCDVISLDGSGSYDLEGAALVYSWELTGAPAGSVRTTADIETPSATSPVFYPDIAGTYTFTLTVNDGGTDSLPVSVTVTVSTRPTNGDPNANAGADQSYSDSVTCTSSSYGRVHTCDDCDSYDFTLSGSLSGDPDGDPMDHAWSVTSGSYGTLSASSGESVTLTVSGVPATYGSTTTETTQVQLVVTDCMGATSTDSVSVAYSCTGS